MEMARDAVLTMADLARLASPAPSVHEEPTRVKRNPLFDGPVTASFAPSPDPSEPDIDDVDERAAVGGHGAVFFAVSALFAALTIAVAAAVYVS